MREPVKTSHISELSIGWCFMQYLLILGRAQVVANLFLNDQLLIVSC